LINIRKAINRKCSASQLLSPEVKELELLIDYNKYDNERQAAKFFLRKKGQIFSMIPSKKCKAHNSLISEYNQHYSDSTNYDNNHNETHHVPA
jgi:hypothetical protein